MRSADGEENKHLQERPDADSLPLHGPHESRGRLVPAGNWRLKLVEISVKEVLGHGGRFLGADGCLCSTFSLWVEFVAGPPLVKLKNKYTPWDTRPPLAAVGEMVIAQVAAARWRRGRPDWQSGNNSERM